MHADPPSKVGTDFRRRERRAYSDTMPKALHSILGKVVFAAAAFAMLLMAFIAGAGLYKLNKWPFGQGYYDKIKVLTGAPSLEGGLQSKTVASALLNFDLKVHGRVHNTGPNDDDPLREGGGLAAIEGGVLIAKGLSRTLHYYDNATKDVYAIALRLPDNNHSALPDETPGGDQIKKAWHRYNDVEFIRVNGVLSLLASYTYFDPRNSCFTNRLAVRELESGWNTPANERDADPKENWRVVFETEPCLPFKTEGHPLTGHQAGGRMAIAPDGAIYLTVGDFEFDGVNGINYAQRPDTDYGKILRIDPTDWSVDHVSMGHRNPQGIVVDDQGRVWSVEHGPMGGDELNLIKDGQDYGWPHVTLGVNYTDRENDNKRWPSSASQGRHDGYVPPVLAWVPSIGISNVKQVQNIHPRWDGDLLASSLNGKSLRRIRLSDDRALYEEDIPFDECIRYVEIDDKAIYILFCDGSFASLTPRIGEILAAEAAGVTGSSFETKDDVSALKANGCFECHSNASTASLSHVFGAKIASQAGVDYSESLQKQTGNWSEENLRVFLTDPQALAPGTSMPKTSLSSQQIDAIIKALMPKGAELAPPRH